MQILHYTEKHSLKDKGPLQEKKSRIMSLLEWSVGLLMHLAVPPQLFSITFAVLGVLKP